MHSIKLKIKTVNGDIEPYLMEYGKLKRIAYNSIKDNIDKKQVTFIKEIEKYSNLLDRSFCGCIVSDAIQIFKSAESRNKLNIVFGGKKSLEKIRTKKISKDEWRRLRNPYIYFIGSKGDTQGNRKIRIDLDKKEITLIPSRDNKILFSFESISKVQYSVLKQIIDLADLNLSPITYKIFREYIVISIDETRIASKKYNSVNNRVLAIDSNPNFIGLSISDFQNGKQNKIFHKIYDIRKLNKNYSKNKKKFELCEISKDILNISIHYRVESVVIEKLEIKSAYQKKGKIFNKLVNNRWNRILFFNNLEKRCNLNNIKLLKIAPQYSSFIGCIIFENETDSVAASLELGRRGYMFYNTFITKQFPKNTQVLYPEFNTSLLNRWNGTIKTSDIKNWKSAYDLAKNSKLSYRILYDDYIKNNNLKVFRFNSDKSFIDICLD